MKLPHFFKACSRIGLKNVPHRMSEPNIGVEEGPDVIISQDFLKQFPNSWVSEFRFKAPEDISEEDFNKVWANQMQDFTKSILKELKPNETQVVVGGEHSISFASISAVLSRYESDKVGYIHFDSHPDANMWSESPTYNWHGMYMRPFLTKFDLPEIENLVPNKFLPKNLLFIGNLDTDPGEKKMIEQLRLVNLDSEMVRKNPQEVKRIIEEILGRVEFLFINFDIDVFDHTLAPSTSIPTPVGFMKQDIFPILEQLKKFPNIALDLVEVNPKKVGGDKTVKLAQEVLTLLLC